MKFFITQACNVANKGDQGIIKSEIAFLRRLFPGSEISVATWWSEDLLRKIEPEVVVLSPMVDFKIKGREVPLALFPVTFIITFILSIISALSVRIGIPPLYRGDYLRCIKNANLVMSSGHQPFVEMSSYRPKTLWGTFANLMVLFWGVLDVLLAKIFNRPFATFPQSAGPFNSTISRYFAKFIFGNLDAICVRENISAATLKKIGIKTPIFSMIDMAFFFEPHSQLSVNMFKPLIGVAPCFVDGMKKSEKADYVNVTSKVLQILREKYGASVLLLPSQTTQGKEMVVSSREDDFAVSKLIEKDIRKTSCGERVEILLAQSVDDYVGLISHLDLLIATRMHPTIFAASVAVPFVEAFYEHKQAGLLESLSLKEVGICVNSLSIEKLLARSDFVWKERSLIKNRLKERVSLMQNQNRPILERLITLLTAQNHGE